MHRRSSAHIHQRESAQRRWLGHSPGLRLWAARHHKVSVSLARSVRTSLSTHICHTRKQVCISCQGRKYEAACIQCTRQHISTQQLQDSFYSDRLTAARWKPVPVWPLLLLVPLSAPRHTSLALTIAHQPVSGSPAKYLHCAILVTFTAGLGQFQHELVIGLGFEFPLFCVIRCAVRLPSIHTLLKPIFSD